MTNFPKGHAKILLGTPMDPILNFLERADRELSENVYFCPFLVYSFLAMGACFETCHNTSKSPVPPSMYL